MVKKIQIKDVDGKVLFEYKKENNTVKDTLEEGVRQGINFYCANLRGADLRGANLSGANIRYADLLNTDLSGVNLSGANIRYADLLNTDLRGANLYNADLSGANIRYADLLNTDLRGANLYNADLSGANLYNADLSGANLSGANLRFADLLNTDLSGANLYNADLSGAKNVPYIQMACPLEGAFIGWKKVDNNLIKLEIPEDAKRSSATTNKCRCSKAKVLSITDLNGNNPIYEIVNNNYYPSVTYKVNEMVYPDSFDEDRWNECSHGIHFFAEKVEAINY